MPVHTFTRVIDEDATKADELLCGGGLLCDNEPPRRDAFMPPLRQRCDRGLATDCQVHMLSFGGDGCGLGA